jgi:hypothetical protein
MKNRLAAAILLLTATPTLAHRLDEYLESTLVSVRKTRVQAEITLTPGVAVYPIVLAGIDTNADGVISETEQRAYAGRVLRDLSLTIDGRPLTLQLLSRQFPTVEEMKDGLGEIRIEFSAELPFGGTNRRLMFENHHQSRIAAYQVNCLVPRDPNIRIVAQHRNYLQSLYQLEYVQAGAPSNSLFLASWSGDRVWLGTVALFLFARFALLRRLRTGNPLRHGREAWLPETVVSKGFARLQFIEQIGVKEVENERLTPGRLPRRPDDGAGNHDALSLVAGQSPESRAM